MQCKFGFCMYQATPSSIGLCSAHHFQYQKGEIDQCPVCQDFKHSRYTACYRCKDLAPEQGSHWEKGDKNATEFFVYILRLSNDRLYVGQTRDLRRRIAQHEAGGTKSTAGLNPILIWYNTVATREQATALELQLKNQTRDYQETMIRNFNAAISGTLPDLLRDRDLDGLRMQIGDLRKDLDNLRVWLLYGIFGLAALIVLIIVLMIF